MVTDDVDIGPRPARPHQHFASRWIVDPVAPVMSGVDDEPIGRKNVSTPLSEHDDIGVD